MTGALSDGRSFSIKFEHPTFFTDRGKMRRGTYATILIVNDDDPNPGAVAVVGEAICNPGDQFNKELGRKLSLERALIASYLPLKDQVEIWDAYENRRTLCQPTVG